MLFQNNGKMYLLKTLVTHCSKMRHFSQTFIMSYEKNDYCTDFYFKFVHILK